jgi:hypothetical protein
LPRHSNNINVYKLQKSALTETKTSNVKQRRESDIERELIEMLGADALKNLKGNFDGSGGTKERPERQKLTDMDKVSNTYMYFC